MFDWTPSFCWILLVHLMIFYRFIVISGHVAMLRVVNLLWFHTIYFCESVVNLLWIVLNCFDMFNHRYDQSSVSHRILLAIIDVVGAPGRQFSGKSWWWKPHQWSKDSKMCLSRPGLSWTVSANSHAACFVLGKESPLWDLQTWYAPWCPIFLSEIIWTASAVLNWKMLNVPVPQFWWFFFGGRGRHSFPSTQYTCC